MAGFFAMGGYGAFVWTGWGLTLVFVLLLWLHTETRLAKLQSQLQSQAENGKTDAKNLPEA
jgi:heme exporter protein CcmD